MLHEVIDMAYLRKKERQKERQNERQRVRESHLHISMQHRAHNTPHTAHTACKGIG